jgi:hypothetical protein
MTATRRLGLGTGYFLVHWCRQKIPSTRRATTAAASPAPASRRTRCRSLPRRGELVVPPERVVREEKTAREQRPITVAVNVTAAERELVPGKPGPDRGRHGAGHRSGEPEPMTGFHEVRVPDNIAYGASGGPEFATTVVATGAGHKKRNVNWAQARGRWDVASGSRSRRRSTS